MSLREKTPNARGGFGFVKVGKTICRVVERLRDGYDICQISYEIWHMSYGIWS
jgi:hypothetical protein